VTNRAIVAAISVHRALGPGFLETVYHRAMEVELQAGKVSFQSEVEVTIRHHGTIVGRHRLDLVVESGVIVELKAVERLVPAHFAQLRSYLRAGGHPVGLLLNIGEPRLAIRRVIVTPPFASAPSSLFFPSPFPSSHGRARRS